MTGGKIGTSLLEWWNAARERFYRRQRELPPLQARVPAQFHLPMFCRSSETEEQEMQKAIRNTSGKTTTVENLDKLLDARERDCARQASTPW